MKKEITQRQTPWPLLWLIILFLIPFILAPLLFLFKEDLPIKVKHTGQLLTPPIAIETLPFLRAEIKKEEEDKSVQSGKWQLIYLCSTKTSKACEAHYDLLQRIHLALGKESIRVSLLYPEQANTNTTLPRELTKDFSANNQVLLIDPRGFLILYYPLPLENPKGMLEDIRRLLRYSHVG